MLVIRLQWLYLYLLYWEKESYTQRNNWQYCAILCWKLNLDRVERLRTNHSYFVVPFSCTCVKNKLKENGYRHKIERRFPKSLPCRVRLIAIILVFLIFVGSITVFHWHTEKYYTLKNDNQTDPISFLWLYWPR